MTKRINSHAHGVNANRGDDGLLHPPVFSSWTGEEDITPEQYIQEGKDKYGLEKVLLLDPAHIAFKLQEIFGDYIIPCPMVNPDKVTPAEIEDYLGKGAKGIKFIAPAKSYGHDDYMKSYEVINKHNALAVFHTGYVALRNFEPGGICQHEHVVDIINMSPAKIDRIARFFPNLKILMAHFGNPWWEEAWKVMKSHKNVYADFSGGTAATRSMNMWKDIFAPDGELDTVALKKLCFGTDGQSFMPGQYGGDKIYNFYEKFFKKLNVPQDIQDLINFGNMEKLTH